MAFDRKNLSGNLGAGSFAPKMFTFKDSASTKATIAGADYFLEAHQVLDAGDMIHCFGSDGGVTLHVTAANATTVTTAENSLV